MGSRGKIVQHRQRSLALITLPLAIGTTFCVEAFINLAEAQIVPDGTLGAESSVVNPDVEINGIPSDRIDGGAARGANLFHSFQDFNVGEGRGAYFSNPAAIENILSRVTGSNSSNILGTLGVLGNANLFFINPNGIVFGPNARLDVGGSFVGSTANSLVFENGFEFSTTNPQAPPLLTINIPIGLRFRQEQPGNIANAGNLAVEQDLTLSAGNLDLRGQLSAGQDLTLSALDTLRIRDSAEASAEAPFIAAAEGELLVQGNQGVDIFALNHPNSGLFSGGDMVLRSANTVGGNAHYWIGGNFRIEQLDGSLGDLFSLYDPIIRSVGDVSFSNYVGASLHILAGGSVTIPGIVVITASETGIEGTNFIAEEIRLSDGTRVSIDGRARPTLDVRAGVNIAEVGIPGLTGENPPPTFFGVVTDFDPNTNDLFFDLGNLFGNILPIEENPTITDTAEGADINIGGIAMLGSNAADGVVFLTNQYPANTTSLSEGNIEVGVILATDNIPDDIKQQLPDDLRNVLDSFGLLDGFSGNGGDVIFDSRGSITLTGKDIAGFSLDSGLIDTSSASGDAGEITLMANDTVSIANSFIFSNTSGSGKGGEIAFRARSVSLTDGSLASASTFGEGQGGNLTVVASESVELAGSNLLAATTGDGDAGELSIKTGRLTVQDESAVATFSIGDGDAAELSIDVEQLIVRDGFLTSSTFLGEDFGEEPGEGLGGDLIVKASDSVELTSTVPSARLSLELPIPGFDFPQINVPIGLFATSQSLGNSGSLSINTGRLSVQGGATASTSTFDRGQGGNLTVNATESVELIGISEDTEVPSGLFAVTSGSGKGGDIRIDTPRLTIRDGALVTTSTSDEGRGGNLTVNATDSIELIGISGDTRNPSGLIAETSRSGKGGDVRIVTPRLTILDGAVISTATGLLEDANPDRTIDPDRTGNAGNLTVTADLVELSGVSANPIFRSALQASTAGFGAAGNVLIDSEKLIVRDGAAIISATAREGNGGNLTVNSDSVEVVGTAPDNLPSVLVTATAGTRDAGDLEITTRILRLRDGAAIVTGTIGDGRGGTLIVKASEVVEVTGTGSDGFPSLLSTESGPAAGFAASFESVPLVQEVLGKVDPSQVTGDSGNLEITTGQLIVRDGAQVSTATLGPGVGGDIQVQANSLDLTNQAFIRASTTGTGDGGRIQVQANSLNLTNGAGLDSSSSRLEEAGRAGNIDVTTTGDIRLDNQAFINADTTGGQGNIELQPRDLLMRRKSRISTDARGEDPRFTGGNITIETDNLVALENSDITANAEESFGGRVSITALGIFGTQFRDELTPESDITATSALGPEFSGIVEISGPEIDPSRGLVELPENVVDPAEQIAQNPCTLGLDSEFIITGRGGLPPSPSQVLSSDSARVGWVDPAPVESRGDSESTSIQNPQSKIQNPIVPARGWVLNEKGEAILVSYDPTNSGPQRSRQNPPACPAP